MLGQEAAPGVNHSGGAEGTHGGIAFAALPPHLNEIIFTRQL